MHQLPCSSQAAQARLDDVPFADERNRYLRHCEDYGASPGALKIKRNELLWICRHLDTRACHGVNMEVLLEIAQKRQNLRGATTGARGVVDIGRPWLRFLGWWRQPTVVSQYQDELDRYIEWMRDDRGFTSSTMEQWTRIAATFLCWCERTNRRLGDLQAGDIDNFFATQGMGRRQG